MSQIFLYILMIFCLRYIEIYFNRPVEGKSNQMGNHIAKVLWNGKGQWTFLCTGSIVEIGKNFSLVVTLARCVYSPKKEIWTDTPEEIKKFKFLVGYGVDEKSHAEYFASNIHVHPCYGNAKKDESYLDVYDIAVIQLSSRIDLEEKMARRISTPDFNQDMSGSYKKDKDEYNILGFPGSENGTESGGLHNNEVSILNKTECSKYLKQYFPDEHPGRELFICATLFQSDSNKTTKDPQCRNNWGSSIYLKHFTSENGKKIFMKTLLGLGGYTENCEKEDNLPGLFVDISKYSCYIFDGKWPLDCSMPKACGEGVSIRKYDPKAPKNQAQSLFVLNYFNFVLYYSLIFTLK